jgi:adenylate kinase
MLGAPGAGKGTQAAILSKQFKIPHISSGDIFRENIKNQTELGKLAVTFMDKGNLVPDGVTIEMIGERLSREDCLNGAVLDGFPRTPTQAQALEEKLSTFGGKIDSVPYIKVGSDELIKRLTGRWTCKENAHIYHIRFNPPKIEGVCDVDGSTLYQRIDDKEETVSKRIEVYMEQTAPLIEYYKSAGTLIEINGQQAIEAVSNDLLSVLSKVKN